VQVTTSKAKIGRPPAGRAADGSPEKTSEYPRLYVAMPPRTRAMLDAITSVQQRPLWQVVNDAIAAYAVSLPPEDRHIIEAIVRRADRRASANR